MPKALNQRAEQILRGKKEPFNSRWNKLWDPSPAPQLFFTLELPLTVKTVVEKNTLWSKNTRFAFTLNSNELGFRPLIILEI